MVYRYFFSTYKSARLLSVSFLLSIGLLSGCAINSGFQTGNLPPTGHFTADNGLEFNIQSLSLATLPPPQVVRPDNDIYQLIQTSYKSEYRISQGDILGISLVGYPEITPPAVNESNPYASGFPVDQQGFVQFPLIGRIKASGLSVPQFTANLRGQLQRYLKHSDPQVKVINYLGNKFFIDGEVRQPGEFAITDAPVSLLSAISMAGGATPVGDSNNIVLNRNGRSYSLGLQSLQKIGKSGSQIYLQDGDSIHVNSLSRKQVYVLGELGRIAPIPIPEQGLNLAHVLGQSGGLDATTANAAKIYIVRDNPQSVLTNIYYIDMQTVTNFALANRFEMHPNDIVYVDATGLARWNRIISLLLPSTSTISLLSDL